MSKGSGHFDTCVVENKGHISQDDYVFELQEILDLSNNMLNHKL